jgi:hypothetical protein
MEDVEIMTAKKRTFEMWCWMLKRFASVLCILVAAFFAAPGCMDRKPAPICPVPTQVNYDNSPGTSEFDGVDLLVVVDNSGSMAAEQQILATGFFTLINSLVSPVDSKNWHYPPVENMRVAIVSSDLGLLYGPERNTEGFPFGRDGIAKDADGDNGVFQTAIQGIVMVESGQIKCDPSGKQCPAGWSCQNGTCVSPTGAAEPVNCPELLSGDPWAETSLEFPRLDLATQVACMAQLGTKGCGIEQQLESTVRALTLNDVQNEFMHDDHLLAVLVVSDEEDCSVKDKGLFETDEWKSKNYDENDPTSGLLNTACNLPAGNEDFLFEPRRYYTELVGLKGDRAEAVVFAAIVGVPTGENFGGDSPCEGRGDELENCLEQETMALKIGVFKNEDGARYKHFQPACERYEGGEEVTSARPGRRYVKVAEEFQANGYVYSICNQDWSPAMKDIARVIAQNIERQCYSDRLEWTLLDPAKPVDQALLDKHPEACAGGRCGVAKCEMVVTFEYDINADSGCPAEFGLREEDAGRIAREIVKDDSGRAAKVKVHCPLPRLPAPLDCSAAVVHYGNSADIGWFYCENREENYAQSCDDQFDNDGDGNTDCQDDECASCEVCGGTGSGCEDSCPYGVEITDAAKQLARGKPIAVQCIQEFSFEDTNCQENTQKACNDGEDNDGNGRFDCIDTIGNPDHETASRDGYHFADPNCCPMDVENGKCKPRPEAHTNCAGDNPADIGACQAAAIVHQCSF